jgi:hypothetical protein
LVPLGQARGKGFPDLSAFRRSMPVFDPPLSADIELEREDRI